MALDSITGQILADRVLFEIGRKVADGEVPPDWWVHTINESVDNAVFQLRKTAGIRFAEISAVTVSSNTLDLSSAGLVPGGSVDKKPETIIWVRNDSNDPIEWINPEMAESIDDVMDYDNLVFWYLLGVTIYIALGSDASASGEWDVLHLKRRTAITALSGSIDLDREFIPIVKADVKVKVLERLRALKQNISDEDLSVAKRAGVDILKKFGVEE